MGDLFDDIAGRKAKQDTFEEIGRNLSGGAEAKPADLPRVPDILGAPKEATPPAPIPIPDPTSPAARAAAQKAATDQAGRNGRAATILSNRTSSGGSSRTSSSGGKARTSAGRADYSSTTLAAG